jgi:hypothetical protein
MNKINQNQTNKHRYEQSLIVEPKELQEETIKEQPKNKNFVLEFFTVEKVS